VNKNALLANLNFNHDIIEEKIEISISDDIVTDGFSKDGLYDMIKRIVAFYEFMAIL
jgi:hypothetical protein